MPPAKPICGIRGFAAGRKRHLRTEVEGERKYQEKYADGEFEDNGISMSDQHRPHRHAEKTADQKRPDDREIKALPHGRKR
jgi:hypothetical protein